MTVTRRGFIRAAAAGGAAAMLGAPRAGAAVPVVEPGDLRYPVLTSRGYNRRFTASPARIFLPADTGQVCEALTRAVADGTRPAVRSGGHCFDDFVDSAETEAIVDLGGLTEVFWDETHRAFSVGAGLDLGAAYRALREGWGVTLPSGICLGVGLGGHVPGGGYGPLSRRHGLVADHLYGVEVVTVDAEGRANPVVATADGPHRDLWWAHTGGGGGNFGVVTRFLFRSRDTDGADPHTALPAPPASVLSARLTIPLLGEPDFVRFLGNYLRFFEEHRAPGNRFDGLYAPVSFRTTGTAYAQMLILLAADEPPTGGPAVGSADPGSANSTPAGSARARALYDEFLAALLDGVGATPTVQPPVSLSYADTLAQVYYPKAPSVRRVKVKAAFLRRAYSEEQRRVLYRHLVDLSAIGDTEVEFLPLGGAVNALAPDATAMPARDSFLQMLIHSAWQLPLDDDRHLNWTRRTFADLYTDTGGVPVPDENNGGCYINYPDPDLADPTHNRSGLPWHHFYYGDNYAELVRIKQTWDPRGVFRHRLSIGQPG
ncbi:MAG TPA: BBE domain-containing protein [Nocardia sp.]|uniref:FAD-dependent oxidoreductase n=1 Tax=Nocardia sp. TaxID=1821 RepID=UPI002B4B19EB|nr:BBE domain-containing protein [Nocardia sp.]HLS77079.1 BBE domain-containing protein [Nocardia sp.]